MEAASGRRRVAFVAATVVILVAAALWAGLALAGGSDSTAKAPAKMPAAAKVAGKGTAATHPKARHDDGMCPFRRDQSSFESSDL